MKIQFYLAASLCLAISVTQAQITKESKTSRGYLRLGFSNYGQELSDDLKNFSVNNGSGIDGDASILDNYLEGRYGAERGYAFEFGRQYYFNKESLLPIFDARLGLDWTIISLSYNEIKLDKFAERDVLAGFEVDETSFVTASASSKLGPVFSLAPIGKLVIDVRAQLAATYFVNITDYYAYNESTDEERYFSFFADGQEDESGLSAYTAAGNFGWKTNFGVTARYGGLGLALDYSPGAIRSSYRSSEGDGEAKFKNNVFQIKLSLTL